MPRAPKKTGGRKDATPVPAAAEQEICQDCSGVGLIIAEDGTTEVCPCGAWEDARLQKALARARIPQRYRTKSLDKYEAPRGDRLRQALKDGAKAYAMTFDTMERGLLLRGVTGCGKTHIAVGILQEVLRSGHTGLYCNVTDLLTRLRHSYGAEAEEREEQILAEADTVDLLVLDDLGAEAATDWVRDRLYLIVNRRYENQKQVLVTTNCDDAELRERVGTRTASRLYEMCEASLEFPREDYRFSHLR